MNIDKIKLELVKLIKHETRVSFVEIENYFDEINFDYRGSIIICRNNDNTIIWDGWNTQACKLIHELLDSELITMKPTDELIYYIGGKILTLPVYKGDRPFKQWLPVVFN